MPAIAQFFLIIAAISGATAVTLGAFGAHALKSRLDASAIAIWQTAVQYQFYHSLALLVVVVFLLQQASRSGALIASASLFALGVLTFSGSLYLLALGAPRWLGVITPLGGAMLIGAWLSLLLFALRQ